jgi:hypothetical protein
VHGTTTMAQVDDSYLHKVKDSKMKENQDPDSLCKNGFDFVCNICQLSYFSKEVMMKQA